MPLRATRTSLRLWPWLLLSVVWTTAVAIAAFNAWPTLPLDLPARDPAVQAALARAMRWHVARYTAVGLMPLFLVAGFAAWRSYRGSSK